MIEKGGTLAASTHEKDRVSNDVSRTVAAGCAKGGGKPGLEEVKENEREWLLLSAENHPPKPLLYPVAWFYLILFYQVLYMPSGNTGKNKNQQNPLIFCGCFPDHSELHWFSRATRVWSPKIDLHFIPVRSFFVAFYSQSVLEKTHTPNVIPCAFLWFVGRWLIFVQIESLLV